VASLAFPAVSVGIVLLERSCELFALRRERQPRRKHPSLRIAIVFDVDMGNPLQRMVERTTPSDEAFRSTAGGAEPEQPLAHPFPNRRQGLVLHFRRRGLRISVFDMPIHHIEIDRPTEGLENQPVAHGLACGAHRDVRSVGRVMLVTVQPAFTVRHR